MVFYHSDVWGAKEFMHETPDWFNMIGDVKLPFFFFLSGMFFSPYTSFPDFLTRKTQKLLLPYLFFCAVPLVFIDLIKGTPMTSHYWEKLFGVPSNGPMWFVLCLFFCFIFYYCYDKITKKWNTTLRNAIIFVIPIMLCCLFNHYVDFIISLSEKHLMIRLVCGYFRLPQAIVALPFFCTAMYLRKSGFLAKTFKKWQLITAFLFFLLLLWLFSVSGIDIRSGQYGTNPLSFYLAAFSGIGALWCVCRIVVKLPVFSYIGRYSLIVLGTHFAIMQYTIHYITTNQFINTAIAVALSLPIIWCMKRIFPHFTAQKDFVEYRNGALHWKRY